MVIEAAQKIWYNIVKINSFRYRQGGMPKPLQVLRLPLFRQYAASFNGRRFLLLSQVEQSIPAQSLIHLLTLRGVGISFIEMEILVNSPALGRPVRSLGIPDDSILPLLIRAGTRTIIPYGDTVL
jgi:hypothetical protein